MVRSGLEGIIYFTELENYPIKKMAKFEPENYTLGLK